MLRRQPGRNGIGQFHRIELLVAPQAHQQRLAQPSFEAGQQQQHLHQLAGVETMGGAELFDRGLARRGQQLAGSSGPQAPGQGDRFRRQGDGPLLVGRIAAITTGENQIFTGIGRDHELLAGGAADGATIGLNGDGAQPAAAENAPIGAIHGGIGFTE